MATITSWYGRSKKGNLMAASDHFLVHIKGKSTHGAEPHNGVDAIVAAANWIVKRRIYCGS